MKIILVADDITIVGGAERVITNLANALCQMNKNEVEIFSIHHSNESLAYPLDKNVKFSFWK